MRVIFPKKIDEQLVDLKQKLLPKTLFFRTMLLVIVPLIVVQIVSVVAYFHGSWGKVGRKLSEILASNMAFIVELSEKNPDQFEEIKQISKHFYDLDVEYSRNDEK